MEDLVFEERGGRSEVTGVCLGRRGEGGQRLLECA